MKIEEIMTRDVRSCTPQDSLSTAAQMMWEADCGAIPVVNGEGIVLGIITDRDVCMAGHLQAVPLGQASVGSAMARDVKCCSGSDTPATVQAMMQQNKVRRIPVVDADRRLIGIISLADLAYLLSSSQTLGGDGVTWSAVAHTFAAISEPRASRFPPRYGSSRGHFSSK